MTRVAFRSVAVALIFAMSAVLVTVSAPRAEAWVSPGLWDPGYIISDQQFFDGGAMSVAEIQAFLNAKVPVCHPEWSAGPDDPIVCLKDYRQDTISRAADAYCPNPYVGAANESAATVIFKVAQACNISPKVLLVTLQKENGLVTHTYPSAWRYRSAMGYGCPDTGAGCDAQYFGFQNQVWRAARQFQLYRLRPTSYNYRAGVNNQIGFHPNAACGAQTVYIQNSATAALYNYTPYVPNAAALSAMPGTGNSCSSYGNRNFWMYYWEWFGSPTISSSLLRTQADPTVYVVSGTEKYPIPDYPTYLNLSALGGFAYVSQTYLDMYTTSHAVGRNFRSSTGIIALLDGGRLYPYPSCQSMVDFGSSCATDQYVTLTDAQIAAFGTGPTLTSVVGTPSAGKYYVKNGTKSEILDSQSQSAANITDATVQLTAAAIEPLPYAAPIMREGVVVRNRDNNSYLLVSGGTAIPISTPVAVTTGVSARVAGTLGSQSLGFIPTSTAVFDGVVKNSTGSTIVLTPTGRVTVTAGGLDTSGATLVSDGVLGQWPDMGTVANGQFIGGPDANPIYVVTASTIRPFDSWSAMAALSPSATPTWTTVPAELLPRLTLGPTVLTTGTLVRSRKVPDVYLIDGLTSKVRIPSFTVAGEAGYEGLNFVSQAALNGYTTNPVDLTYGYQCGATKYMAAGGVLHKITASQEPLFPISFVAIDGYTCAQATVGTDATRFIRTPDGVIYLLEAGIKRPVATHARWLEINGGDVWVEVQTALADLIPTGSPA